MAFLGGQFKSATHGQFKSAQGGQFDRLLQSFEQINLDSLILRFSKSVICKIFKCK